LKILALHRVIRKFATRQKERCHYGVVRALESCRWSG